MHKFEIMNLNQKCCRLFLQILLMKSYYYYYPFLSRNIYIFEVCHVGGEEDSKIEKIEIFKFRIINTKYFL